MSVFASCADTAAGVPVIACFMEQASYLPAYAILIGLFTILFFKMSFEPTKDRFAASLLVVSIVALLFAGAGFIPSSAWSATAALSIGSAAMLAIRRGK